MKKNIINALEIINKKLKNKKIKWIIGGSTSLYLQGINIKKTSDIDIATDKEGAFKINEIFKEHEIKPVKFSKNKIISSYRGKFKIKNIEVDIMGELKKKIGNKWVNISRRRLKSPKFVKIRNIRIPVTPLEQHLASYKGLRRKKD